MDWLSCNNIFESITQESLKKQVRFASPMAKSVGEFAQNLRAVPQDRKFGFWMQYGGTVQKWVHEELSILGFNDQRFKFKKQSRNCEVEFFMQNLTSGVPVETLGQDTVEAVLQALFIALKDM